jgi:hypothetical protein
MRVQDSVILGLFIIYLKMLPLAHCMECDVLVVVINELEWKWNDMAMT